MTGKVPPLVDEMASHRDMRIQTNPSNKNEVVSTIKEIKLSSQLLQSSQNCFFSKIAKKDTHLDCNNWRRFYMLPAIAKIIAKITLINREQARLRSGFACIYPINTLRIILKHCSEFKSPFQLPFIDLERAVDCENKECWEKMSGILSARRHSPRYW